MRSAHSPNISNLRALRAARNRKPRSGRWDWQGLKDKIVPGQSGSVTGGKIGKELLIWGRMGYQLLVKVSLMSMTCHTYDDHTYQTYYYSAFCREFSYQLNNHTWTL